ncbi:alpha/beta hydrolase [Coxiella endosymbiont of Dermacentor marginatus]|uniref:alpha/beta hydrolase n=1 Tax=Coxiella endosymbiont of Dermacentor marginatus TaxID=1656159 RepID=UPI00222135BA|nr:alpha/beta hydrolase [Coxiella endosymbiont of Dermacentor marginatus]
MNNSLERTTIPSTKVATGSVIWLHGLGASGRDFTDIIPQLALPKDLHLRFIFPHAPMRSITINAGMRMRAWYDIYSLADFAQEDEKGIAQAQRSINQLIEEEISHGVPSHRIILAGFSQGGAVALYTGLRYLKPLAGIIALSTYLPCKNQLTVEMSVVNQKISIFMAHGNLDPILPLTLGRKTFQILSQLGYLIEWHDYATGHQICYEEIKAISNWLTNSFS